MLNHSVDCPFCGYPMPLTIEVIDIDQDYVEDCTNCCNPIHIKVHKDDQHKQIQVFVDADNEQYY